MTRRTGLIHRPPGPHLPRLSARMGASLWTPKASVNWHAAVKTFPMLRNDKLGICVPAGMLHTAQLHMANAWGSEWVPSDDQATTLYTATAGYDPVTGQPDIGTDPNKAFSYWTTEGLDLGLQAENVVLPLVLDVDNAVELSIATEVFGFVGLCLNLPRSVEDATGNVMDVPPQGVGSLDGMPGGFGGHFVTSGRYEGGALIAVSWGAEWEVTPTFMAAYGMAAYSGFSPAWVDAQGGCPAGLSRDELMQDMARLAA